MSDWKDDLLYRDSPICPHCGFEEHDAWELDLGDEESTVAWCSSCSKQYHVTAHVAPSYSTKEVKED